jgi:hypothetical protein
MTQIVFTNKNNIVATRECCAQLACRNRGSVGHLTKHRESSWKHAHALALAWPTTA